MNIALFFLVGLIVGMIIQSEIDKWEDRQRQEEAFNKIDEMLSAMDEYEKRLQDEMNTIWDGAEWEDLQDEDPMARLEQNREEDSQ